MKEIVVIISFSNLNKDSRVKRQIEILKKFYKIIYFGYGNNEYNDIEFFKINQQKSFFKKIKQIFYFLTFQYKLFTNTYLSYDRILHQISKFNVKAFILNDSFSWPLIDYLDKDKCLIDAHEYTPAEFQDKIIWKILIRKYKLWCSSFVRKARYHFCVEKNLCQKWFEFSDKEFIELRNFSFYKDIKKRNKINYPIKIVHHGIANNSRKIEYMISSIINSGKYYEGYFYLDIKSKKLEQKLNHISTLTNIKILKPIKESILIKETSKYDLAILSIYPSNINYKYCLPNKLFQFIQARLPIVSGPTPSIIEIINYYKIGVIADSFDPIDLTKAIQSISFDELNKMKNNCDKAAKELCWEKESKILLNYILKF